MFITRKGSTSSAGFTTARANVILPPHNCRPHDSTIPWVRGALSFIFPGTTISLITVMVTVSVLIFKLPMVIPIVRVGNGPAKLPKLQEEPIKEIPVYVVFKNHGITARVSHWNRHSLLQFHCQGQGSQGDRLQVMVTVDSDALDSLERDINRTENLFFRISWLPQWPIKGHFDGSAQESFDGSAQERHNSNVLVHVFLALTHRFGGD